MKVGIGRDKVEQALNDEKVKQYNQNLEKEHPGYLKENRKLYTMAWIVIGLHVVYSIFYLAVTYVHDLWSGSEKWYLFGTFFLVIMLLWMLSAGKVIAVLVLLLKAIGIASSLNLYLPLYLWPLPIAATMLFSLILNFIEAAFCLYVLFNRKAAKIIRLNRDRERLFNFTDTSKVDLKKAQYINSYNEEKEIKDKAEEKETGSDGEGDMTQR